MPLGNLFIFMGDHRASHTVIFWMLGGLGLAQWGTALGFLFHLVIWRDYSDPQSPLFETP